MIFFQKDSFHGGLETSVKASRGWTRSVSAYRSCSVAALVKTEAENVSEEKFKLCFQLGRALGGDYLTVIQIICAAHAPCSLFTIIFPLLSQAK